MPSLLGSAGGSVARARALVRGRIRRRAGRAMDDVAPAPPREDEVDLDEFEEAAKVRPESRSGCQVRDAGSFPPPRRPLPR